MVSPDPYEMTNPDYDGPRNHYRTPYAGHDGSDCSWGTVFKSELPVNNLQHVHGTAELAANEFYFNAETIMVEAPMTPVNNAPVPLGRVIRAVRPVSSISTGGGGITLDPHTSGTMTMSDLSSQWTASPPSQAGIWEQGNNSSPPEVDHTGDRGIAHTPNDSRASPEKGQ